MVAAMARALQLSTSQPQLQRTRTFTMSPLQHPQRSESFPSHTGVPVHGFSKGFPALECRFLLQRWHVPGRNLLALT